MTEYWPTPDCSHLFWETRLAYITPDAEPKITYKNEWWIPKFETYKMDLWAKIETLLARADSLFPVEISRQLASILSEEWLDKTKALKITGRTWFAIKVLFEMAETSN